MYGKQKQKGEIIAAFEGLKAATYEYINALERKAGPDFVIDNAAEIISIVGDTVEKHGGNVLEVIYAEDMARKRIKQIKEGNNDR